MIKLNLDKFKNYQKKTFLIFSDFVIIIFSILASYSLRLEEIYSLNEIDFRVFLLFLAVFYIVFFVNNIYQILIRYFDYFSINKIVKSIFWCFVILVPINFYLYKFIYFPRSISFIAVLIIGTLIISQRIFINFVINLKLKTKVEKKRTLIIGVNNFNIDLIKNIRQKLGDEKVEGLIDTKNLHKKRELNGIKIYKKSELNRIIEEKKINEIIIGKNSLTSKDKTSLFKKYENKNIRIKNLDFNKNKLSNYLNETIISNLNFFDIINRPKIKVKKTILEKKIKNKIILITGGGGSIGSELCLEILKHKPKKVFILDISELNLFNLINKIKEKKYNYKKIKPILGDCNDIFFLNNYFKKILIDDIYHAAAYKHVNLGEENPYAMIKNNIFATKTVVNFALKKGIKNFIFISSDKAVRPKSILGFSKKFGEKIIKSEFLNNKQYCKTKFTIVRFGNVIGSSGSVIPIFLDQIKRSMPLTVTHKSVKRYFMSISEAVQLVINASYLNKDNIKIYAINMGKQILIYDLAKRLIRLCGYTIKNKTNKHGDIPILITGLKKGEKLSEEISLGENLSKTSHSDIMLCNEKINILNIDKDLNKIQNLSFKNITKININNFSK